MEIIISLIIGIFNIIFSIIAKFFLFKKVGIPRWKAFVPIYSDAIAFKVTGMSMLWVFSQIPQSIISAFNLEIPVWLKGLVFFVNYGVDVIFAIHLAKAFHRKLKFKILSFFFPNLMQLIASVSKKYEYDEHYNRYKYRKIYGKFVEIDHVKEEKELIWNEVQKKMKEEILSEPEPQEKEGVLKKFTDFIVEKHKAVLFVVIVLAIWCAMLSSKVNINRDLTKYMPASSDTSKGLEIMYDEFDEVLAMPLSIMVDDLSDEEKIEEIEYIKNLEGVASVTYNESEEYNKDNHTLYELTISGKSDSENGENVIKDLQARYKEKGKNMSMRGEVATANAPVLPLWVIAIAVLSALIILIIMSDSYVEPVLYLVAIGFAVIINRGTNILLPSVSQITNSITSVLQLALSMDYSIMLATEYHREKLRGKSKIPAMKSALSRSFTAISASSVTTIVGMLVLILMSFTIGRDLGIVLAKGVLLCLFAIFTVLPALLIIFDGLIEKTHKTPFKPKLDILGNISYKIHKFSIVIFLVIMGVAFFAQQSVGNLYTNTDSEAIDDVFGSYNQTAIIYNLKDHDKISEFCKNQEKNEKVTRVLSYDNTINQPLSSNEILGKFEALGSKVDVNEELIDIIYRLKYALNENKLTAKQIINKILESSSEEEASIVLDKVLASLEDYNKKDYKMTAEEFVNFLYDTAMEDEQIRELMEGTDIAKKLESAKHGMDNAKDQLIGKEHGRVIIRTKLPAEGEETMEFIKDMEADLDNLGLEEDVYLVGNSSMAYEMSKSFSKESIIITIITAVAIYIVVAISFKSWSIPLILVAIIQTAVWITLSITGVTDGNIYFLSLIIVQSLLMGATIDYAIMFTEQYVAARKNGLDIHKSVVRGYNKSIQAILTSAGVLTLVTAIVGNFASSTAAKICKAISDGTFFSTLLILLLLPALMAACDRFVVKREK
ncbi:MAG: MMPL family transporter [Clostridia bacterium]|nr:MMPL family transporter [Clostridia bacterium]